MAPRTLGPLRDAALGSAGPLARRAPGRPARRRRLRRAARGARDRRPGRAGRRGRPLGGRRHARRPGLRRAPHRAGRRGSRADIPRRRDRRVALAAPVPRDPRRRAACTGSRCDQLSRHAVAPPVGGQRRRSRTSCTAPRAATRSSSPRRWRRPTRACPPASSRPCWRAWAGSARTAARRSSSSPSSPRTWRASWRRRCSGRRVDALVEAELAGVLEVRPQALAFRHELARRAIEASLPAIRRRSLNAAVVAALLRRGPAGSRAGHAPRGRGRRRGDDRRRRAGRGAGGGGRRLAPPGARALRVACSPTSTASAPARGRRSSTTTAGSSTTRTASARRSTPACARPSSTTSSATPVAVGECLVRVSRHLFMAGDTDEAQEAAPRAVATLEPAGDEAALAHATLYRGAVRAMTDAPAEAAEELARARGSSRSAAGATTSPRCRSTTSASPASSSATCDVGVELLRAQHRRVQRGATSTSTPRAGTATWPSCSAAPGGSTSSSTPRATGCASPASAASGRTPTTSRSSAAPRSCGAAAGTAPPASCAR